LDLIASENYAGQAVLEAQGSSLTNKYAEGYPGRRYYSGCAVVDDVETLAVQRAKQLFGADHANVQPHSGTQANLAIYAALLDPGDTVLGMNLAHGGHLSHGSPVSYSGQLYRFVHYGVDKETERLDYAEVERLAMEHRPRLIVAGASAYPRIIDFQVLRKIADLVGARLLADMAHIAGLVAAGLHPSPVPVAQVVASTTHKTLRGPRGGIILCHSELAADIDRSVFPGTQGGPLMHVIAAKAVAFQEALQPAFVSYQQAVLENARVLASELQGLGFRLVAGGTDTHLLLVDLSDWGITGRIAEDVLQMAGICVNRNSIPFDPRPPQTPSGIRLGTPAVTTRGLGPQEMRRIAALIHQLLRNHSDQGVVDAARREVEEICHSFPVPGLA